MSTLVIIIIRHELGLNTPVSASRLRPTGLKISTFFGILLLFIFLHVLANWICIFLVFRQLFLLSALPKFLHSFVAKSGVPNCSSEKFNLDCPFL
jgi:hypothetical protein